MATLFFPGCKPKADHKEASAQLAPKRYVEEGADRFHPMSTEERTAYFQEYCRQFTTDKVVCYCKSCRGGLLSGGKQALHILELLFPAE